MEGYTLKETGIGKLDLIKVNNFKQQTKKMRKREKLPSSGVFLQLKWIHDTPETSFHVASLLPCAKKYNAVC